MKNKQALGSTFNAHKGAVKGNLNLGQKVKEFTGREIYGGFDFGQCIHTH